MNSRRNSRHYDKQFGEMLRRLRQDRFPGLSLRAFASEMGISASYLSYIEIGRFPPPSADLVVALAKKLEYDTRALLDAAGHQDPILRPFLREDLSLEKIQEIRRLQGNYYISGTQQLPFPDVLTSMEGQLLRVLISIGAGDLLRALGDLADTIQKAPISSKDYEAVRTSIDALLRDIPKLQVSRSIRASSRKKKSIGPEAGQINKGPAT
jgi:transcriptional regulator with XRE-family HTH domain